MCLPYLIVPERELPAFPQDLSLRPRRPSGLACEVQLVDFTRFTRHWAVITGEMTMVHYLLPHRF